MPNRVSCNGSNEITLQTIVSSINAIEFERGGIAWGAALPYQPGDLVSLDLAGPGMYELYRCVAPHTSVDITIPAEFANWELVTSSEIGGVHYKGAADYNIGDIVTAEVDNGVDPIFTSVYRCTTLYTSGAGTPAGFFAEIANWEELAGSEQGGIAWATPNSYVVGDMVTEANTIHICIRDHSALTGDNIDGDPLQPLQTAWMPILNGISQIKYNFDSDILGIIPPAVPPGPHIVNPPDQNGPHYFSIDNGKAGKIIDVYVQGIKVESTEFDLLTDGYVNFTAVVPDNSWVHVIVTEPEEIAIERGGIAWDSTTDYVINDTVVDSTDNKLYRAILPSVNVAPNSNLLSWGLVQSDSPHGYITSTAQATYTPDMLTDDFFDYILTEDSLIAPAINTELGKVG